MSRSNMMTFGRMLAVAGGLVVLLLVLLTLGPSKAALPLHSSGISHSSSSDGSLENIENATLGVGVPMGYMARATED